MFVQMHAILFAHLNSMAMKINLNYEEHIFWGLEKIVIIWLKSINVVTRKLIVFVNMLFDNISYNLYYTS